MIYFGIPLKSRAASRDWAMVGRLFNRTLWSVYNQSCPEFRIIVAHHELPSLDRTYDDRVEFIQVDAPIPRDLKEQMYDKGYKLHTIGCRVRELGGGHTMIVDADDLVSRELAELAAANPDVNGWYAKTGYIVYLDRMKLKSAPRFPGGTNAIVNYDPADLPPDMEGAWSESMAEQPYIIRKGHGNIRLACEQAGRPLEPIPFRGVIYVLGTGDNHSTLSGYRSPLRWLFDRLTPSIRPTPAIREEFSLDWLD